MNNNCNNEEEIERFTLELPKLKSEVLEELGTAEKTRVFDYKLFEKELKTEKEKINTSKKEYKKKIFKFLIPVALLSLIFVSIILQSNIS